VRTVYHQAPETETTLLTARIFGIWNLLSTIVRIWAARNIHQSAAHDPGLLTYCIALLHFGWELVVEGSVEGVSLIITEIAPVVSIVWMLAQRGHYVTVF
jgi:hypothetical protein